MINLVAPNKDCQPWVKALKKIAPQLEVTVWPALSENAKMLLCWQPPAEIFAKLPDLECVSSMGAGVDGLVDNSAIPDHVQIVRLVDSYLKEDMFNYIHHCIESYRLKDDQYRHAQAKAEWSPDRYHSMTKLNIGILGFGEIGRYVAEQLQHLGFKVAAWKQSPGQHPNIDLYSGDEGLLTLLKQTNILICVLPLTSATENILNEELFEQLPNAAVLIQVGRGKHLVEEDLIRALDQEQLGRAYLDVFRQEPLPGDHPFWGHAKIKVTPHIASLTRPESVAQQIVDNYQCLLSGKPLQNVVDRKRGY